MRVYDYRCPSNSSLEHAHRDLVSFQQHQSSSFPCGILRPSSGTMYKQHNLLGKLHRYIAYYVSSSFLVYYHQPSLEPNFHKVISNERDYEHKQHYQCPMNACTTPLSTQLYSQLITSFLQVLFQLEQPLACSVQKLGILALHRPLARRYYSLQKDNSRKRNEQTSHQC